jgi:hypothetical protein
MEVPTARFTISSARFCPWVSYVFTLPRSSSCLLLHPLMLLPVVVSSHKRSCRIAPRSLMLLHSGGARRFFPNVHPFGVPLAIFSLARFFRRLCSTVGPLWPRLLRHATPAWWVILLQTAANSFCDPPLPWVRFFGWPWRPTAICRSQCRFFDALTVFTAASSLGTSWCSALDTTANEFGS